MKKADIIRKLSSFGVKATAGKTVPELREMLNAAQSDGSKPGCNIATGPQPGDAIGRAMPRPTKQKEAAT